MVVLTLVEMEVMVEAVEVMEVVEVVLLVLEVAGVEAVAVIKVAMGVEAVYCWQKKKSHNKHHLQVNKCNKN